MLVTWLVYHVHVISLSKTETFLSQCALPTKPAPDRVGRRAGLRFGMKPVTYLEFNRKLKIRKKSEFSIKFKTTDADGIIFYVANDR